MLLGYMEEWQHEFELGDAQVFFEFPLYRDDERLVQCQFLIVSRSCGIVLVGTSSTQRDTGALGLAENDLDAAYGQLISRLVKNLIYTLFHAQL